MYQSASILYHLTTASRWRSGDTHRFRECNGEQSPFRVFPGGDLWRSPRALFWVATARNPPRCTPVREGRGGRCRVAAGRATVVGGRPGPAHGDRHACWLLRSVVLVEAGMARRPGLDRPGQVPARRVHRCCAPASDRGLCVVGVVVCERLCDAWCMVGARVWCLVSWSTIADREVDPDAGA